MILLLGDHFGKLTYVYTFWSMTNYDIYVAQLQILGNTLYILQIIYNQSKSRRPTDSKLEIPKYTLIL